MNIEVKNNSVNYYVENNNHILDFGNIKYNTKAIADIRILDEKNIRLEKTCGCTSISPDAEGNAKIEYMNTNSRGSFMKTIKAHVKDKIEIIKIKGTIV